MSSPLTLHEVIDGSATDLGDHPFLEDARSSRVVSYRALRRECLGWSQTFESDAVPDRATVGLLIDDPLDFAVCYLAVIATGRVAVPLDPQTPVAQLERVLSAGFDQLISDRPELSNLTVPVLRPEPLSSEPAHGASGARTFGSVRRGAMRLSTSGSTGAPKTVELTEQQLLHVARNIAAHNELTENDRGFCSLPLFHINAEVVGVLATLVSGATLVLDRRFRRTGFWELLTERRITWLNAVPAILAILARDELPAPLAHLRFIRSASASLPVAVRREIELALAVPLVESYGMTEAASQITATPLREPARAGSVGRPIGVELEVRDDDRARLAPGEVGRVWLRGDGVIRGYVDGRSAERFDADGWLDTGDVGHLDDDGFLYLSGRADDVINRGGELVYPLEVQEVLLRDRRVREAVVVGRADDILGAVPVAKVIAASPGLSPEDELALVRDLEQLCEAQLSRFKRPVSIDVVADLPRAATGKIRTQAVRELVRSGGA